MHGIIKLINKLNIMKNTKKETLNQKSVRLFEFLSGHLDDEDIEILNELLEIERSLIEKQSKNVKLYYHKTNKKTKQKMLN